MTLGIMLKRARRLLLGKKKSSYVLIRDKGPTFIYSHLVNASKFSMIQTMNKQKGGVTIYTLPKSALEHITYAMEQHRNVDSDENKLCV